MNIRYLIIAVLLVLGNVAANAQQTLSIENNFLKVVVSTLGAEMQSIKSVKTSTEYLWQGDEEHWVGKAPVMFPVNVKFKDEHFTYKGKEYEMPDMGLAKISNFELVDIQKEELTLILKSNAATLKNYPFAFSLQLTYKLIGTKVVIEFVVRNTGNETMYFALGAHPGLRFPVEGKNKRSQNRFIYSKKYTMNRTEIAGGLVQDNKIPFLQNEDSFAFDDARIPNAGMFIKNMPARKIGIGLIGKPAYITVDLGGFPNVNMWTPPGMPFACIEPMLGHHDLQNTPLEINKKPYLIPLSARMRKSYNYSITVNE